MCYVIHGANTSYGVTGYDIYIYVVNRVDFNHRITLQQSYGCYTSSSTSITLVIAQKRISHYVNFSSTCRRNTTRNDTVLTKRHVATKLWQLDFPRMLLLHKCHGRETFFVDLYYVNVMVATR